MLPTPSLNLFTNWQADPKEGKSKESSVILISSHNSKNESQITTIPKRTITLSDTPAGFSLAGEREDELKGGEGVNPHTLKSSV
jgi:hypothetical protein